VAEVEKILRLVADGVLTPAEADTLLAASDGERDEQVERPASVAARHLRIEVTEGGRRVVNLRVPINIAGLAGALLPGLSDDDSQRIREAIASGERGPLIDVVSPNGDRVLIVSD